MFRKLMNNKGENEPAPAPAPEPDVKMVPQSEVDRIVQERLARDRAKFADYEDLRKKAEEYDRHKEQMTQQDLEKKQEYDKLKEGWSKKEQEYQGLLNQTKAEVQSERINNTLNQEILKKNAYPETVQLLKSMTKYNEDGTVTIRGKDANGIESDLPVEQGVELFLKDRPYLVKGSGHGGAGTAPSAGGQVPINQDLSKDLQNAMAVGDRRTVNDIKARIRAKHAGGGIVQIL